MSHLESPIIPTIGRIVLVRGEPVNDSEPRREYPAIVTRAYDQNFIDLMIFAPVAKPFSYRVQYHSDTEIKHDRIVWRWMDYQVQNAVKKDVEPEKDVLGHHGAVIGEPAEVSTPLSRVKAEHHELEGRWLNLSHFLCSKGYEALSKEHRVLLLEQQEVMARYSQILEKRIRLLDVTAR